MKIICGGQTGVDRAALDAALEYGISRGGWCPAGRLDEEGRIPDRYPVVELPLNARRSSEGDSPVAARTRANVEDSDGTLVIYKAVLRGGTAQTVQFCDEAKKPCIAIDAESTSVEQGARKISDFVTVNEIVTLNVAGPRKSEWPEGYAYASDVLQQFFRKANRDH